MKNKILFLLALTLVFVSLGFNCKKKHTENVLNNLPITLPSPLPVPNQYTSPKGVLVASVNPIPVDAKAKVFAKIDEGIDLLFQSTEGKGYAQKRSHADYIVVMMPPSSRSMDGNCPTLNLKDGMKIAGTVVSLTNVLIEPPFILIAENFNESKFCNEFLRNVTRYEAEHITAYYNDRSVFNSHLGANDIHPIYPLSGE